MPDNNNNNLETTQEFNFLLNEAEIEGEGIVFRSVVSVTAPSEDAAKTKLENFFAESNANTAITLN